MLGSQPRFLITNEGTHTPEQWAELSLSEIIDVQDTGTSEARAGARLKLQILDVLERYYTHVQTAELVRIDEDGDGIFESPIDGHEHTTDEVVDEIAGLVSDAQFQAGPGFRDLVARVVQHHTMKLQDVERSTWADRNPSERAAAWQEARQNMGYQLAHTKKEA